MAAACSETQPRPQSSNDAPEFFGVATLEEGGMLCLHMRSKEPDKPVAEAFLCYTPDESGYRKVREHIGAISVGESKEFGPFEP